MSFEEEFPTIMKTIANQEWFGSIQINDSATAFPSGYIDIEWSEFMGLIGDSCVDKQRIRDVLFKHYDWSELRHGDICRCDRCIIMQELGL